jgi:hypothetical protein
MAVAFLDVFQPPDPTKVVQVKNTVGAFNLQTCILYFPEGLQAFLVRVH